MWGELIGSSSAVFAAAVAATSGATIAHAGNVVDFLYLASARLIIYSVALDGIRRVNLTSATRFRAAVHRSRPMNIDAEGQIPDSWVPRLFRRARCGSESDKHALRLSRCLNEHSIAFKTADHYERDTHARVKVAFLHVALLRCIFLS